jgi:hypothetical protein
MLRQRVFRPDFSAINSNPAWEVNEELSLSRDCYEATEDNTRTYRHLNPSGTVNRVQFALSKG